MEEPPIDLRVAHTDYILHKVLIRFGLFVLQFQKKFAQYP